MVDREEGPLIGREEWNLEYYENLYSVFLLGREYIKELFLKLTNTRTRYVKFWKYFEVSHVTKLLLEGALDSVSVLSLF